jgi:hypothetical protein
MLIPCLLCIRLMVSKMGESMGLALATGHHWYCCITLTDIYYISFFLPCALLLLRFFLRLIAVHQYVEDLAH